tara:strand:- start:3737 stop:3988 length:252 start_codon:yes stop_codon:yes gene_type:complete
MDSLKERIVSKAKELRLDSFATQKNNPKLKELLSMSESEIKKVDIASIMENSPTDIQSSQDIVIELFQLIDELIVSEGGSLPE